MSDNGRDPEVNRWLEVTRQALRAQAAWGRASVDLARSALSGELDTAGASKAYAEAVRREGTRYWRTASKLGAEYARDVAELGSQVATSVLEDVARSRRARAATDTVWEQATAGPTTDTAAEQAAAGTATSGLVLRGALGSRATGTITVANRHPRARRIELAADPLVDELGAVVAEAEVVLEPARTTVAAGQEDEVTVSCELTPGVLQPGLTYRTTIRVTGGEEADVSCTVVVS